MSILVLGGAGYVGSHAWNWHKHNPNGYQR